MVGAWLGPPTPVLPPWDKQGHSLWASAGRQSRHGRSPVGGGDCSQRISADKRFRTKRIFAQSHHSNPRPPPKNTPS